MTTTSNQKEIYFNLKFSFNFGLVKNKHTQKSKSIIQHKNVKWQIL
jgi:hypothetical protein